MSFRKELKTILSYSKINSFNNWLNDNNGKLLFNERNINSIYYDNKNFKMYFDSIEGIVPRKKIRVRNYNEKPEFNKKNNNLELKISSVEGRFKTTKKLSSFNINNFNLSDNSYGLCNPVLCVSYKRTYYNVKGFRLTIDKDISYRKVYNGVIAKSNYFEKNNIIEIKHTNLNNNLINESFPFVFVRFSKYCRGIEILYKI
tara:strand:+ start:4339 stop:4941 length:603 start_codon:yes stop_codon:yes gene_type:complete